MPRCIEAGAGSQGSEAHVLQVAEPQNNTDAWCAGYSMEAHSSVVKSQAPSEPVAQPCPLTENVPRCRTIQG